MLRRGFGLVRSNEAGANEQTRRNRLSKISFFKTRDRNRGSFGLFYCRDALFLVYSLCFHTFRDVFRSKTGTRIQEIRDGNETGIQRGDCEVG